MGTIPKDENKRGRTSTNEIPGAEKLDERQRSQKRELIEKWVQQLSDWFPHLCLKTYFVPPIHVNKIKYLDPAKEEGEGKNQGQGQTNVFPQNKNLDFQAYVPTAGGNQQSQGNAISKGQRCRKSRQDQGQGNACISSDQGCTKNRQSQGQGQGQDTGFLKVAKTKQSDYRDDRAQVLVEKVFWSLSQKRQERDVMVVLSKFSLDNYLNKTLSGASGQKKKGKKGKKAVSDPKAKELFPTPADPKLQRGDFDLLIVHKEHGFIIIEIKAIGDQEYMFKSLEDHLGDKEIADVLVQMDTRQRQLEELTADLGTAHIPVKKIAAFPSVSRAKLKEVMADPKYSQLLKPALEQYLGNDLDLDKALSLWLCEDEVNSEVTSSGDDVTLKWWTGLLDSLEDEHFTGMDEGLYKQLVARFCGPLSTVEVCRQQGVVHEARSLGDAVHEMRTCFNTFVLRQEQMHWYWSDHDFVYLTGPPGSGKTLLLLLKAVSWLQDGDEVVVVRGPGNLPGHLISQVLRDQILSTLNDQSLAEMVRLETISARTDPGEFVEEMARKSKATGRVRFLVDELWLAKPSAKILGLVREVLGELEKVKESVGSGCSDAVRTTGFAVSNAEAGMPAISDVTMGLSRDMGKAHKRFLDALCSMDKKIKSWSSIHAVAQAIVTAEIKAELERLSSVVCELQTQLATKGEYLTNLDDVEERISNVLFYVDVVTSWLASPVLHDVMQKARRNRVVGLWCTGFWPNRCPDGYTLAQLSTSIRCPAHVQDLLDRTELLASHTYSKQYEYVTSSTQHNPPLPAEGPHSAMLTYIDHGMHVKHNAKLHCVSDCLACAQELASVLLDKLCVGKEDSKLEFGDVLVVGRALLPIKPDSAFIRALRGEHGIPVSVVVRGCDDVQGRQLESNSVLVTNTYNGHGLERAVVVFVPDIKFIQPRLGGDGNDDGDGGGGDGDGGGVGDKGGGGDDDEGDDHDDGGNVSGDGNNADDHANTDDDNADDNIADDDGEDESRGGSEFDRRMRRMGENNQMGMWFIASRCLAHVIIFHV